MTRRRLVWLLIAAVLAVGAGAMAWSRSRTADLRAEAAAGVAPRPDLQSWPEAFRREVELQENRVFESNEPVEALAALAALYHANGFYAEAQQAYTTLRTLKPKEPRWCHLSAHIHAVFGEMDQAIPLWRQTVALAPDYLPAQVGLGDALIKAGQADEAAPVFQRVLERESDNVYAQLGLARVDVVRENWPAARAKLERIASQTQGMLGADLLASAYERTGAPERGTALRARQKSHGIYVPIADPWIDALMEHCYDAYRLALESGTSGIRNDHTRAQRLLERALRLNPKDAYLLLHAGTQAEQRGDLDGARTHLQAAVKADPLLTDAWAALTRVTESQGNAQAGWRVLSDGLAANPESPVLLLERGRRYKAQGRTDAAIADFRRVTRLRRDEALAFIELASLYFTQERVDEGIKTLEEGLEAEPGHPIALSIITFASIHAGRQTDADRWFGEIAFQPRVPMTERTKLQQAYQQKFGRPAPAR